MLTKDSTSNITNFNSELSHIKLKNGDDLIGFVDYIELESVRITGPIQYVSDPAVGTYSKKWLHLSEGNDAIIMLSNIMMINKASHSAIELYIEVLEQEALDSMSDIEENMISTEYH